MGRIIRRTVTITITESWTIVWTTDDTSPPQVMTNVQEQPKPQEEPDETILPSVTTVAATEAQSNDVTAKPKARGQRKRTRGRLGARDQPST